MNMNRGSSRLVVGAVVALVLTVSMPVSAQPSGTAPVPEGETAVGNDATAGQPGATTATAQPASVQPAPGQPTTAAAEDPGDKTRFRFAAHLLGGPWFVPDRTGGGGGVGLQLGAQINDMTGVYYSGTAAVAVAGGGSGIGAAAGAFVYNSVMFELTLARILQLGLGPSLDSLAFGSAGVTATSVKAVALAGTFIGAQTRVGVALGGGSKPGKKGRFMLGLEVHPTFVSGGVPVSTFLTIGGGSF